VSFGPRTGSRTRVLRGYLPSLNWEPVSGFEPLTCRLQEVCSQAAHALAAPMAQSIALMAPTALGLFGASSHEPFHADGRQWSMAVTERGDQNPPQRRRNLTTSSNTTVEQVFALPNWAVSGSSGAGSGAPRAGLRPWGGPPGAPAPSQRSGVADLVGLTGHALRLQQASVFLAADRPPCGPPRRGRFRASLVPHGDFDTTPALRD